MPLMKGHSREVVAHNIKEMVRAGHPHKQAIAAALASARKYKKMSEGGMPEREENDEPRMPEQHLAEGGHVLDVNARHHIASKNFALPGERYPIEDAAHARNALARVSQHGSPHEKEVVREKVHAKYPGIGEKHMAMGGTIAPDHDEHARSDFDQEADRGLLELNELGKFEESDHASPESEQEHEMLARALHRKAEEDELRGMAMGGLVEGEHDEVLGTKPSENMESETEEPMSELEVAPAEEGHAPVDGVPITGALSKEAHEAAMARIEEKRKRRRMG